MVSEKSSKTIKITMPYSYANQFIEESRINFNDCRWLNIAFKDKVYQALFNLQPANIQEKLEQIRQELIDLVKEMYRGCKNGKS